MLGCFRWYACLSCGSYVGCRQGAGQSPTTFTICSESPGFLLHFKFVQTGIMKDR